MSSPIRATNECPRWRARATRAGAFAALGAQLRMLKTRILEFDQPIMAWHRSHETSMRLDEIPGVGPALATALVASVADPKAFRSARHFSAWVGLVPTQHSNGGKDKLGSISKQGDPYLRSLFTAGALAVIRYAKIHGTRHRPQAQNAAHYFGILNALPPLPAAAVVAQAERASTSARRGAPRRARPRLHDRCGPFRTRGFRLSPCDEPRRCQRKRTPNRSDCSVRI
jgi:transposase IS116/IS110/IS902 family protein